MKTILLASQSPRRRQLLEQAEITFSVQTAATAETYPETMPAEEVPLFIAKNKARAVWEQVSLEKQDQTIVIAADTVVVLENKIIGKPKDEADAFRILSALSGKMHEVITGVVLMSKEQPVTIVEKTTVSFRQLTPAQIRHYIQQYRPFDKAGAYAIQEWIGLVGVEKINGDYYNVVGLPVNKVVKALEQLA